MKNRSFLLRLTDLKISRRLSLGFGLLTALLISVVAVTQYENNRVEKLTSSTSQDIIVKLRLTNQMSSAVYLIARSIRTAMLLKDDPAGQAVERDNIAKWRDQYESALAGIGAVGYTERGRALMNIAEAAKANANPLNDRVLTLLSQKNNDEALKVLLQEVRPAVDKWQRDLQDFADFQNQRANDAQAEAAAATAEGRLISLAVAGAGLMLTVFLAWAITRSITQPLNILQRSIQSVRDGGDLGELAMIDTKDEMADIGFSVNQLLQDQISAREKADTERLKAEAENEALNTSIISILQAVNQLSQRDLTAKAPVTQDVIGTVSDSINALTEETSKVLRGVRDFAGEVELASGKVKSQANLVARTADEERESVRAMLASLAGATEVMNQVAELVQQSDKAAEQATRETDGALETVNGTVKGMESIRETIAETEKRIKRLGERSQEISGIVSLINTISERTHVLALNAAMQAAVAGEAGRGFAVVAEEVQRLAESSRNATQQIATLVSNIQLETNETINTVNRTIGQVVQGSEQAQKAGDQMRRTQTITAALVSQVRRMASSSEQQKATSAQLLKSVEDIGQSTERTAQQIVAQNQETDSLLLSARRLVDSVSVFKLPLSA